MRLTPAYHIASPLLLAAAFAIVANGAQAAAYQLVYTGAFNSQDALNLESDPISYFAGSVPFTINALFDDSSANLAPAFGGPFDGFRAYAPSSVTITIGGSIFSIETIASNATAGVTVAIFDRNSFLPDHYGVGLLADPVNDGAGIIGDFLAAAPNFTAGALTPTVFKDYWGVGYGSGVCLEGPPDNCIRNAVTPFVLHDSSHATWNLTLGNYDEDYPVAHTPDVPVVGTVENTATILAVPEPPTGALMLAGLAVLGTALRRRPVESLRRACRS